jgi:hypothetical protein
VRINEHRSQFARPGGRVWSQSGRIGASPSLYAVLARLQHAGDDAIFDLAAVERRVVESADADFGTLLAMRSSRRDSPPSSNFAARAASALPGPIR